MAQANRLTNVILAPFTAGHKPSTRPIRVEYPGTIAEGVARRVL
jgi:hypothetical protein